MQLGLKVTGTGPRLSLLLLLPPTAAAAAVAADCCQAMQSCYAVGCPHPVGNAMSHTWLTCGGAVGVVHSVWYEGLLQVTLASGLDRFASFY